MIRITRLTDYGVVLLTRFAEADGDAVLSAPDLSAATGIPQPTVSKILKRLTRSGLLESRRGIQGGYSLAKPAATLSVAEVVECLEGPIALTDCAGDADGLCEIEPSCPVRANWQRITDAVRDALRDIPLTEMVMRFPIHHDGATP